MTDELKKQRKHRDDDTDSIMGSEIEDKDGVKEEAPVIIDEKMNELKYSCMLIRTYMQKTPSNKRNPLIMQLIEDIIALSFNESANEPDDDSERFRKDKKRKIENDFI